MQYLCSNQCNERKNSYLFSRSAVLYNQAVSYLIKQLKYHDNTIIVRMFVNWLIQAGKTMIDKCDFVIPVPIHKNKLKIRKYNQAALLGNLLSKRCNKIFVANLLTKIRDTQNQSKLSKHQRMKNLKGVFCVKENLLRKISNKTVLLIDDVITTGSTANECSNALLQNGAKKVLVLTVAKRLLM